MRLHALVLLSTALLSCIDGVSAIDASKLTTAEVTASHSRFLRKFEEERGIGDSAVSSTKLQKYKLQWSQMHLGDDLGAVLKSDLVGKMAKFNLNKAPSKQVSLIGRLTAKYGDDIVARALVSVERSTSDNPALLAMARQIREDQIANWLKNGETVPGVVSKLKFVDDESIFRSKALGVLEDFIKEYNKAKHGDETLLKTLTTVYGGESELVTMIAKARVTGNFPYRVNPQSVEKANSIESQLIRKWKSQKLELYRVMAKLDFDNDINKAMSSGKVKVLFKYADSKTEAFKRLEAKYGKAEVAVAFMKEKGNPFYGNTAKALYQRQMNGWLENGDTAERVFSILKFKEGDDFFYKLGALEEYVKFLKTKNPDDATDIFKVLKKGFGPADEDKLALAIVRPYTSEMSSYQKSLYTDWVTRDLDPMSVGTNVFKIPELDVAAGKYSDRLKSIIKQYTTYYKEAADLPEIPAVRVGRS
ncbi:hypothetical protein P3T76_007774 [Phytophthora citrophthora]|uniref:RxLR effector protein n=1 Tax=Phytophthora citrophthora TaxID=4793 RepID=A0AAD9GMT1_9STRA|nr:hypothetical protein P3T76_007774 [Phytophthora citrophthora]